ncbi:MAG TPA: DUF2325 domain-containing protein [Azoarcus taiwanensis]|uniref:DUF2325 domain-containing protein n=1 Tax=Azoarcus taiwanensis TaxID=666964 RepID=A0A972F9H2_9RHOO|nr:DUF2325 domain-containing protein [Azoarcus taiwanensis]NMG04295.1 DUF2325 domain-containing protein [Azoarcus taiwanensis]HRQ55997.1 DUF2325 domain-containing protein [Azoarcus taiwanensis]
MNALVVGADRLGNIPEVLNQFGIRIAGHVSGRDSTHQRRSAPLPAGTDVVILFTDFLGHNVMQRFREAAQREQVTVVCCRRSVCALQQALGKRFDSARCDACAVNGVKPVELVRKRGRRH